MFRAAIFTLSMVSCCCIAVWAAEADTDKAEKIDKKTNKVLKYDDGRPDGKKSIAGSGEMIQFTAPGDKVKIKTVRIYGSRYGYPQPPKEDFTIYVLNDDRSDTLHTEKAPYSLFRKGPDKWVDVKFKKPVETPSIFWIVLDFKAEQTKGVYVSYDTSTEGKHSMTGLPGGEHEDVSFGGDWMIRVETAE